MLGYNQLIDLYNTHCPMDPYGRGRMTFEEFLISMDVEGSLPPRRAEDIRPLKDFLENIIFTQDTLQLSLLEQETEHEVIQHHYKRQRQIILNPSRLIKELGPDYVAKYSFRDWTVAVEEVLVAHNCPKSAIVFGMRYRVGFGWPCAEGSNGVLLSIAAALLKLCHTSSVSASAINR